MGEIADMMIEGFLDSNTGEYLDGKSPGYPRTKNKSLPWEKKQEDLSWKKVIDYLNEQKIVQHKQHELLKKYANDKNIKYSTKSPIKKICFQILKNFEEFKRNLKYYV